MLVKQEKSPAPAADSKGKVPVFNPEARRYRRLILLIIGFYLVLTALFLYIDRTDLISGTMQRLGWAGALAAVLLMALVCMTPIPSEGLIIMLLKIYGLYWGLFLGWTGFVLSSLIIFFISRYLGIRVLSKLITPECYAAVNDWVRRKGTFGLFFVRLLPVPAFAVNYLAGVMPAVPFIPYMWTAAVTILPYYVGTALMFTGIFHLSWVWIALGCLALLALWTVGYFLNKSKG